jgi:hypothetical protein
MPPDSERAMEFRRSHNCSCLRYFRRAAWPAARNSVEARLVDDDGERRFEQVEIDFLRHDADAGFRRFQLAVDVVAEDFDGAAGLVDQRGDDADGGGLAGAVRSEQREEIALGDLEVDGFERFDAVFVSLGELAKDEGLHRSRVD